MGGASTTVAPAGDSPADEPLQYFLVVRPVSIYSCLFILHGVQPVLFSQFVK